VTDCPPRLIVTLLPSTVGVMTSDDVTRPLNVPVSETLRVAGAADPLAPADVVEVVVVGLSAQADSTTLPIAAKTRAFVNDDGDRRFVV